MEDTHYNGKISFQWREMSIIKIQAIQAYVCYVSVEAGENLQKSSQMEISYCCFLGNHTIKQFIILVIVKIIMGLGFRVFT